MKLTSTSTHGGVREFRVWEQGAIIGRASTPDVARTRAEAFLRELGEHKHTWFSVREYALSKSKSEAEARAEASESVAYEVEEERARERDAYMLFFE